MVKRCMRTLLFTSIAGLALFSAACTRSVTTPLPTSTGAPGSFQQATMEAVLSAFLTQTAQAIEPSGATPTPDGTPEPGTTPGIILEPTITPDGTEPVINVTTTSGTPTATGPIEHIVQAGEWLYSIARMYDVDHKDIIDLNGLTPPYNLYPGQVLLIPTEDATPQPGGTTYVVQAGDRVWSIASQFGVDPDDLIEANDLVYPYTLYPGQTLIIP